MDQAELIREMYTKKQMSTGEIGNAIGMKPMNVRYQLVKNGVPLRSRSDAKRTHDKSTLNENAFQDINDPSVAYWVGFFIADGNIWKNQVSIALAEKDYGHLVKFKEFLGSSNKIGAHQNGVMRMRVDSKALVEQLSKYSITPNKTWSYILPEDLIHNRHVARGMVDGDGWIGRTRELPGIFLCGNKHTVSCFKEYVSSLTDSKASVLPHRSIWRYNIAGKHAERVLLDLYQDDDVYYLDRKRKLAYELTGRALPN